MTDIQVEATEFTHAGRTCPGAMGYSFAAGTTDGERQPSIQSDVTGYLSPAESCTVMSTHWLQGEWLLQAAAKGHAAVNACVLQVTGCACV